MNDIDRKCKEFGISNYTITDNIVDVNGNVNLFDKNLNKIPIKFGKVTGNFTCAHNRLTNLENCPKWVGGNFYCQSNNLESIIGPDYIGGDLFMDHPKDDTRGIDVFKYSDSIYVTTEYNKLIKILKREYNINKVLKTDI